MSLVEMLVSMSIFGVVMVALTATLISSVRSVADQRLRAAATRVASDRLEQLRGLPFAQLVAQAGSTTTTTPDGKAFTVDTLVTTIDAATSAPTAAGRIQQIKVTVGWKSGTTARNVSYTTAVSDDPRATIVQQAIGTITMFPSPTTTDASGRPLADIDVTVPMGGFPASTLVNLSWTNKDGTAGAKTLTSTTGLNWRGTIAKEQVLAALGTNGLGQVQFTVSAGTLSAIYGLSVQKAVPALPLITGVTIDRNPITVAKPASGKTCAASNQCQNTTDVVLTVNTTGFDPTQDSVVLQFQLYDSTYQELALAPVSGVSGQWRLTIRSKTTKFRAGTLRAFRFTATRFADNATASSTLLRDVLSI